MASNSSSRFIVLGVISVAVVIAAVWLVIRGIDFTGKQKRAGELAESITTLQNRMRELYDRRSSMITKWLDEQTEKKPVTDAKTEAAEAAALAGAQSAGGNAPAPAVDPVKAQEELNAVRAALEASRALVLQNQQEFDQFDRLQNQISNYVAQTLLEQLRVEAESGNGLSGNGLVTLEQIREFEQLEMEIINTRRDYHEAAFERNRLLAELSEVPFGLSRPPTPVPVFAAERILNEQRAGR